MILQNRLDTEAKNMGAAYFGVANISLAKQGTITPSEQKLSSEYPYAVSVGVPLATSVVDKIGDQSDYFALRNYWFHVHQVINPLIDQITARISFMLMSEGHSALPIPASQTVDKENLYGLFSNKLAASLAGLGWIGKSCLLITQDRGPRVRWGTVLTNAPLEAGNLLESKCGKCIECVEACPIGAFTGREFNPEEGRQMRMIVQKCYDFYVERGKIIGHNVCGICIYVCPWGALHSHKG